MSQRRAPSGFHPGGDPNEPDLDWSSKLEHHAIERQEKRARQRPRRRRLIAAAATATVIAVAAVATVLLVTRDPETSQPAAADKAPAGWCVTGTTGAVTTISDATDQKSPVGAVSTYLDAILDNRSAASARAVMSEGATNPTVADLQQFISTLPATTNAWCAQVTTTDSTARLLVNVRARIGSDTVQIGPRDTFYVSAAQPDLWTIDAVVAGDGDDGGTTS